MARVDAGLASEGGGFDWRLPVAAGLVSVAVFVAYVPCLDAEFVDWDDDKNFLQNEDYRGLGWRNIKWMFTTTHMGPYQPMSWLTLGLDYTLWGMNPHGYHLTNVLLHSAGAGVLCLLVGSVLTAHRSGRFGKPSRGVESGSDELTWGCVLACVVAALAWAVHPQRVESVAWITERRDVLSALFYLLCVWAYLQAHRDGAGGQARQGWERFALVCCALALLSKAMAVSIPAVLIVLDVFPLGRLCGRPWRWHLPPCRQVLFEKFNFVLFVALAVVVGFLGQAQTGALQSVEAVGLVQRVAIAGYALFFYVSKTVWPVDLAPLYPRPQTIGLLGARFLVPALAVVGISVVLVAFRRRLPSGLAAWACYVLALLPVAGIVTIGDELVADRYSHLPTLSLFVLLGGGFALCWELGARGAARHAARVGLVVAAAGILTALTLEARRIMDVWHDSMSLWTYACERRPESHKAWNNLAGAIVHDEQRPVRERFAAALPLYHKAIELRPDYATGYFNLGCAYFMMGQLEPAREAFEAAIAREPSGSRAYTALGTVLNWEGRPGEAKGYLERAIALDRKGALHATYQLGESYRQLGKPEEAVKYYRMALERWPRWLGPLSGLADAYLSLNRVKEAEEAATEAVRTSARRPEGRYANVQVLVRQERFEEALAELLSVLTEYPVYRQRALKDPHLRELRLEPRFQRMMRLLPSTAPAGIQSDLDGLDELR
ncbi:MAG: tetratricopeptide repeat protein [Phycisphaerae bacterium]|nr:tetratricopeptide repeat protein [Phycisphaerae bacterium]